VIFALLAAAGAFLAFHGLVAPRVVRLDAPQKGLGKQLQARLDAAELPVTAREFTTLYVTLTAGVALMAVVLGTPALALAGAVIVPALLWQRFEARRDHFRQEYDESLAEVVQLLREGFAATGAMRDALHHVVRNGSAPAGADFAEVWNAQATGEGLEQAFAPIVERRRNPYLRMVAEALALKASEGGSAGEVLLGLETMIREQVILKREIAARQSQARMEAIIVSLAPIGFFLAVKILPWMRGYEGGFYSTALGQIVLAIAVVFSMLTYFLSRRLANSGLTLEVEEVAPNLTREGVTP
jgi:Flp pilus assembly protein TadB